MLETDLYRRIIGTLQSEASRFGLRSDMLNAERVLNWGGFVSQSFKVGDGERTIHVKLASDPGEMRRWFAVCEWLEREYRAPRVLGWLDIPGTSYGGLAFEHIDGATWEPAAPPELIHDLIDLMGRLHDDRELAAQIGGARTYRECWELRYREQFEQDLITIRGSRPASVTDADVTWMEDESRELLAIAPEHAAFEGASHAPCHWDLWWQNVMVAGGGAWWVIDWDSLAVGDEAEDYATLVWPFVYEQNWDWRDLLGGKADGAFADRIDLHLRAITLDYLIDVLADWSECDVPEWQEAVRPRKEAEHRRYLDWYRRRWGNEADP